MADKVFVVFVEYGAFSSVDYRMLGVYDSKERAQTALEYFKEEEKNNGYKRYGGDATYSWNVMRMNRIV